MDLIVPWSLVLLTLFSATAGVVDRQQCSATKNSVVKLMINSRRNETGQWQSQVSLFPPEAAVNEGSSEFWSLLVEQRTSTDCDDKTQMEIRAEISQESDAEISERPIPAGYELFPGVGHYKFHSESVIWARAQQVCVSEGAHLVIVNSEQEANVIKQYFDLYPKEKLPNHDAYDSVWVGVYEQGADGQYFTIFGEKLSSTGFTRWHPGRPAERNAHECLILYRPLVGLYDLDCKRRAPFVCEFPRKAYRNKF